MVREVAGAEMQMGGDGEQAAGRRCYNPHLVELQPLGGGAGTAKYRCCFPPLPPTGQFVFAATLTGGAATDEL